MYFWRHNLTSSMYFWRHRRDSSWPEMNSDDHYDQFDTAKGPWNYSKLQLDMWGLVSWQSADRPFLGKSSTDNHFLFYDWSWLKFSLGSVKGVKSKAFFANIHVNLGIFRFEMTGFSVKDWTEMKEILPKSINFYKTRNICCYCAFRNALMLK